MMFDRTNFQNKLLLPCAYHNGNERRKPRDKSKLAPYRLVWVWCLSLSTAARAPKYSLRIVDILSIHLPLIATRRTRIPMPELRNFPIATFPRTIAPLTSTFVDGVCVGHSVRVYRHDLEWNLVIARRRPWDSVTGHAIPFLHRGNAIFHSRCKLSYGPLIHYIIYQNTLIP